jgi:hypothetical protein
VQVQHIYRRQLSNPQFSMAPRSRERVCYRQTGPSWRQCKLYFSSVSSTASRQFRSPLFSLSLVSTHSTSRLFSAWFPSFIDSYLSKTLPSGESGTPTSLSAPRRLLLQIPLRPCMWLVRRGVLASPVDDYLPRAPSPIQFLPCCIAPSLAN